MAHDCLGHRPWNILDREALYMGACSLGSGMYTCKSSSLIKKHPEVQSEDRVYPHSYSN